MRGALIQLYRGVVNVGLIPARAGSTYRARVWRALAWAHPRPCGEHCDRPAILRMGEGSSPPVRGAQQQSRKMFHRYGLIPARAGSTGLLGCRCRGRWAHPRPCGEHARSVHSHLAPEGSSPPVRGARQQAPPQDLALGLIPARAGSTSSAALSKITTWAHPRPCGEHCRRPPASAGLSGSSPPVRGAPPRYGERAAGRGLIPARAGSTPRGNRGRGRCGAHPRPCGEHM